MKETIDIKKEVLEAENRIRSIVRETPLEYSPYLSRLCDCHVYLKLENIQLTGSFKLRGAANKILSLSKEEKEKGLVTASSGNHGLAFAYLIQKFNLKGTIFLPENVSSSKTDALCLYGVEIKQFGDDCVKAEIFARDTSQKEGMPFISPYNDPYIIGGQGTIAIELDRQVKKIDAIMVPVGGGGLISGIGGYMKQDRKNIQIVGCQPQNSAVMFESVEAGKIVERKSLPTLSDGTAGGIEPGAITLSLCQEYVDEFVLLTEDEIAEAVKLILENQCLLIEGAAALPVAALVKNKEDYSGKTVVLILSGAKISLATLKKILFPGE